MHIVNMALNSLTFVADKVCIFQFFKVPHSKLSISVIFISLDHLFISADNVLNSFDQCVDFDEYGNFP